MISDQPNPYRQPPPPERIFGDDIGVKIIYVASSIAPWAIGGGALYWLWKRSQR